MLRVWCRIQDEQLSEVMEFFKQKNIVINFSVMAKTENKKMIEEREERERQESLKCVNGIGQFMNGFYEKSERMTPFSEIYQHYLVWCSENEIKSTSRICFSRVIVAVFGKHGHIKVMNTATGEPTTIVGAHARLKQ